MFDFNNSTGVVSNSVIFSNHNGNYGCEFSPDGSKLYISQYDSSSVFQYDISSNDSATMVNTQVHVTPMPLTLISSLQLAPNGKIYLTVSGQTFLSVIENPNEAGLACDFKLNGIDLSSRSSRHGLPNFISNYLYKAEFEAENFCVNKETCFEYIGLENFDSLVWDFDDDSGLQASNEKSICHQYVNTGTYYVKLFRWYLGKTYTSVITITINPLKHSAESLFICEGDSIFLQGEFRKETGIYFDTIFNGSYQGCDSIIETSVSFFLKETGFENIYICSGDSVFLGGMFRTIEVVYYDTISNGSGNGCDSIVEISLAFFSKTIGLTDVTICASDSVFLGGNYQTKEGVYYDTLFNGSSNGCDSVFITNLFHVVPEVNVQSFDECEGFSVSVESSTYSTSGIYKDIINGCDTTITHLTIYDTPAFYFNQVEDTCSESKGSVVGNVFSGKPPYTYYWSNGSMDSEITGLNSGVYSLTVVDSYGCVSTDTVEVMNLNIGCELNFFVPTAFSPNGDGSNDVFRVFGQHISKVNLQILNRWGEEIFRSADIDFAWDGTYLGQPCQDGVYTVILYYETPLESGTTFLFRGTLHLVR